MTAVEYTAVHVLLCPPYFSERKWVVEYRWDWWARLQAFLTNDTPFRGPVIVTARLLRPWDSWSPPKPLPPSIRPQGHSQEKAMSFKFELKQPVTIAVSGETGEVIGRAEYTNDARPSYLLRYKDARGGATEAWWREDALTAANPA